MQVLHEPREKLFPSGRIFRGRQEVKRANYPLSLPVSRLSKLPPQPDRPILPYTTSLAWRRRRRKFSVRTTRDKILLAFDGGGKELTVSLSLWREALWQLEERKEKRGLDFPTLERRRRNWIPAREEKFNRKAAREINKRFWIQMKEAAESSFCLSFSPFLWPGKQKKTPSIFVFEKRTPIGTRKFLLLRRPLCIEYICRSVGGDKKRLARIWSTGFIVETDSECLKSKFQEEDEINSLSRHFPSFQLFFLLFRHFSSVSLLLSWARVEEARKCDEFLFLLARDKRNCSNWQKDQFNRFRPERVKKKKKDNEQERGKEKMKAAAAKKKRAKLFFLLRLVRPGTF